MARYNSSTNYGSSVNYGAGTPTEAGNILWQLLFDWDNDGTLDSTNESGRLTNVSVDRGRPTYLTQNGQNFESIRPGKLTLTLDNFDRRYDPRYASSPLYPNVKPGRKVYLAVVDLSTNTTYVVFTGIIDDVVPLIEPGGGEVQIECLDYLALLNDQAVTFAERKRNVTLSAAFTYLLDQMGYPVTLRKIDADSQPFLVYEAIKTNGGQIVNDLSNAGRGTFFVDRYGRACYYGRLHSYSSVATITQSQVLNEPVLVQPWAEVYNDITAVANRPIKRQPSVIWYLTDPVALAAGVGTSISATYDSAYDVAVDTYEANSQSDGGGTDLTSSTSVTGSLGFRSASLTATCSSDGYLTSLQLRGSQMDVIEEEKTASDATSINTYGRRRFLLQSPYLQDANYAQAHATAIKDFAKDDRESITIQIDGREDLQFIPDLMDKVHFESTTLDIDKDYWVMGIKHDWKKGAQGVVTTLDLATIITVADVITPSGWLTEDVSQAPEGFEDPAGDLISELGLSESGTGAFVEDSFTLSNTNDVANYIPFETVMFDTSGSWSSALPSALTFTSTGLWLFGFSCRGIVTNSGATGEIALYAEIRDSSDTLLDSYYAKDLADQATNRFAYVSLTIPYNNTGSGNYVRLRASLDTETGSSNPYNYNLAPVRLWVVKV